MMLKPTAIIAALILVASANPAFAQDTDLMRIHSPYQIDCIPDDEFRFGAAMINASLDGVISAIGSPQSSMRGSIGLDDFLDETVIFDGLKIYGFQGRVGELLVTGPQWSTPSGLQTGLTRQQLITILGSTPRTVQMIDNDLAYDVYFCNRNEPFDLGIFFRFRIDGSDTVRSISIFQDWP